MFGFALTQSLGWLDMICIGFGVFLLAAGGASLNSLQEYKLDAEMQRTKNRPLVQGHLSKRDALIQAVILIGCGLTVIFYVSQSIVVAFVGVIALILYNGIYTPLKRITLWSIFPGAICGAVPPYIGWLSGGGEAVSFIPILLFSLFVLWQIPHFWLVILEHKSDYSSPGLPNLLFIFKEKKLKRFFVTWIGALVVTMLMFITQFPYSNVWQFIIITNSLLLLSTFIYFSFGKKNEKYGLFFIYLNISIVIHMSAVVGGMRV